MFYITSAMLSFLYVSQKEKMSNCTQAERSYPYRGHFKGRKKSYDDLTYSINISIPVVLQNTGLDDDFYHNDIKRFSLKSLS